jgi:hypothetical protein
LDRWVVTAWAIVHRAAGIPRSLILSMASLRTVATRIAATPTNEQWASVLTSHLSSSRFSNRLLNRHRTI